MPQDTIHDRIGDILIIKTTHHGGYFYWLRHANTGMPYAGTWTTLADARSSARTLIAAN